MKRLVITACCMAALCHITPAAAQTPVNDKQHEDSLALPTGKTDWVDPIHVTPEHTHYVVYPTLQRALECTFGDVENPYSKIYFDAWHPQVFACQHARHIIRSGMKIRMFVGDRDRLYEENGRHITQRFHELLNTLQIPHTLHIVPGANHNPTEIFADGVNDYDVAFWDNAFQ